MSMILNAIQEAQQLAINNTPKLRENTAEMKPSTRLQPFDHWLEKHTPTLKNHTLTACGRPGGATGSPGTHGRGPPGGERGRLSRPRRRRCGRQRREGGERGGAREPRERERRRRSGGGRWGRARELRRCAGAKTKHGCPALPRKGRERFLCWELDALPLASCCCFSLKIEEGAGPGLCQTMGRAFQPLLHTWNERFYGLRRNKK